MKILGMVRFIAKEVVTFLSGIGWGGGGGLGLNLEGIFLGYE